MSDYQAPEIVDLGSFADLTQNQGGHCESTYPSNCI